MSAMMKELGIGQLTPDQQPFKFGPLLGRHPTVEVPNVRVVG